MFAQWILLILVLIGICYCGYRLLFKTCCGHRCEDEKNPEAIRLLNLQTRLEAAKRKADVLSTTEGVGEQLVEVREEIKEHELEIAEILGDDDE